VCRGRRCVGLDARLAPAFGGDQLVQAEASALGSLEFQRKLTTAGTEQVVRRAAITARQIGTTLVQALAVHGLAPDVTQLDD